MEDDLIEYGCPHCTERRRAAFQAILDKGPGEGYIEYLVR
jgi:hypothetical protein